MKKVLIGVIIGCLVMTVIPVAAEIQEYILHKADYTLIINGTEYTDDELPILNYKGYTYCPVRSVLEAAGLDVSWDAELQQAEVKLPEPTEVMETKESEEATEPTKETDNTETTEPKPTNGQDTETPTEPTNEPEPTEETPTEPTDEPGPEPELTRREVLESKADKCTCGATGGISNRRTVFEGDQEYVVADVICINRRCRFYGEVIGYVRWKVVYE